MSKRYNGLWPQVTSFDNLLLAFHRAARGKRSKPSVATFEFNLEANLLELRDELRRGAYRPGAYDSFHIHEPKRRLISAAPYDNTEIYVMDAHGGSQTRLTFDPARDEHRHCLLVQPGWPQQRRVRDVGRWQPADPAHRQSSAGWGAGLDALTMGACATC